VQPRGRAGTGWHGLARDVRLTDATQTPYRRGTMANVLEQREVLTLPHDDHRTPNGAALALLAGAIGIVVQDDLPSFASLKDRLRELLGHDPMDSLLVTVLGGGLLFYLVEREHNPRCATYWDAVLYVATSLSVGYDDVFPKTRLGNMLASAVQTLGPAMAANALTPPATATRDTSEELLATNRAILARLDEIAAALRSR